MSGPLMSTRTRQRPPGQWHFLLRAAAVALIACNNSTPAPPLTPAPSPSSPPGAQQPVDAPCQIAALEWRDRSDPPLLEKAQDESWLRSLLLPSPVPARGWTLFWELAVVPADHGEGRFHYGIRGFLKDLNQAPAPVLEAGQAAEGEVAGCGTGLASAGCRERLRAELLTEPSRLVLEQLLFQCRSRVLTTEQLLEAFKKASKWQLLGLAQAAGEMGDASLVPDLVRLLEGASQPLAIRVIGALGRIGSPVAVGPLVRQAQGAPEAVVRAVMVALADIGSPAARRYLETWSEHHPLAELRALAGSLVESMPE
jgi:hypothetical protein